MEKDKAQMSNPLGQEKIGKLLVSYSVPVIIAVLINAIYNIVDQIFIGHGVGPVGNAATTVTYPIVTVVSALGSWLGGGGTTYAAIKLGQGDKEEAEKTFNNLFVVTFLVGVLIAVVTIIFLSPILRLTGALDDVVPYAKTYSSIILIGVPFNMISLALSGLARVDGNPKISMYGMLVGAILNTILDPIYIFVFHWGVGGAALATITSQIISAGIVVFYFAKKSNFLCFRFSHMKLQSNIVKEIIVLGTSSGIIQFVAVVMQLVMNNSLVHYCKAAGVSVSVALGGMGVALKILMIFASLCMGLGIGAQPIIGFNYGAKQYLRIREAFVKACIGATVSITIGWILCQIIPHTLAGMFGKQSQEFISFTAKCIKIYLGGMFAVGFEIIATNYFQATKQPLKASVLSLLRQLILLVPLLIILPYFFGLNGILFSGMIADISSAIIIGMFIIPEIRQLGKKAKES